MSEPRYPAILLLGPTAAGKTPLGQMLQQRGWDGSRCVHFDFGENLRAAVRGELPSESVSFDDIEFLRGVLEQGALLEDKDFPLAERILRAVLAERQADRRTVVVLNGLPRHAGQAAALQRLVAVHAVICLECTAETIVQRIREDPAGDRAGRADDQLSAVVKKLSIYQQRTAPLVEWYQQVGARVLHIPVSASMTAEEMWSVCACDA
jgi:adenylate kinase